MVGAIAFQEVKSYFEGRLKVVCDAYDEDKLNMEGYVRFNKLFLKTTDPQLKIEIFQQKNQIIKKINLALEKIGYATRIVDIITK
ncbi:MAG: hypothetical protein WCJ39_01100 [bacterium]